MYYIRERLARSDKRASKIVLGNQTRPDLYINIGTIYTIQKVRKGGSIVLRLRSARAVSQNHHLDSAGRLIRSVILQLHVEFIYSQKLKMVRK